jgi:TolA-binding protein
MSLLKFAQQTVVAGAILCMAIVDTRAQAGADLAERTFRNAEQLLREGKRDQAVNDFQQVVQAFPQSTFAADALSRLGSIYYPAEGIWDLGTISVENQQKGKPFFDQIRERYPQSRPAPHAMYKLGLLAMEPMSPDRNLDAAYASFFGVVNIYPGSRWGGASLQGAALTEIEKQNFERAIIVLERALDETPAGVIAADSQYLLGVANSRIDDHVRAAEAFQASRLAGPSSTASARSLNWLTLLYNTRLRAAYGEVPRFSHDQGFVPKLAPGEDLRGASSITVTPEGLLAVADPKRGEVILFGIAGEIERRMQFPEVLSMSFDALGLPILRSAGQVSIAGQSFSPMRKDKKGPQPVEEIGHVWRDSSGKIFLIDLKQGELLGYTGDPRDEKVLHSNKASRTRISAFAPGPMNDIIFLDLKSRGLMKMTGTGMVPLGESAAAGLQAPVDLAVDLLGNIYVLDAKLRSVVIFGPDGVEMARISPETGSLAELAGPKSIAVGPRGEVYVYDNKKRTVLRFN